MIERRIGECPQCRSEMREMMAGSAGNLGGKKWFEVHYECDKCKIFVKYVETAPADTEDK